MKLEDFMEKYCVSTEQMAVRCNLSFSAISSYIKGIRKPTLKNAVIIERVTGGEVTVMDLKGVDKRKK